MLYSGSGGTNNSASSGGHNDNSSTSARYSSSSTLPSSTDVSLDEKPLPVPKDAHHVPIPPIPQPNPPSLRAAGRAFSFGRKKAHSPLQSALPELNSKGYPSATRERAMTESSYTSGSTATPPKLLDSDLDLGDSDAFGNMFESFGKRRSQVMGEFLGSETTESPVSHHFNSSIYPSLKLDLEKHVTRQSSSSNEVVFCHTTALCPFSQSN